VGSCENGNESSGAIKGGQFVRLLTFYEGLCFRKSFTYWHNWSAVHASPHRTVSDNLLLTNLIISGDAIVHIDIGLQYCLLVIRVRSRYRKCFRIKCYVTNDFDRS
jgi:hypothetical protein